MEQSAYPAPEERSVKPFLQSAVDHYPQLLAFRFTLRSGQSSYLQPEKVVSLFVQELRLRIDDFMDIRQQQGKPAPPTLLRIRWASDTEGNINMLLLVNRNTFFSLRHDPDWQYSEKAVVNLLSEAGSITTGHHVVPDADCGTVIRFCICLDRSILNSFSLQYDNLLNSALLLQHQSQC